ncbi:MAG: class II fructose-bisphosphatase [Bdellovibrionales bacterium]|nr:class II fructose-bisphosphatase [Bdellovibrionales bacterium]
MDRNLALEFVRITEAAALASAQFMGRGNEKDADQAAVDAMRRAFDSVNIDGTVVIGEGERDEAPMLFIGEKVGRNGAEAPEIDIALDPLEGTTICAKGGVGAISVIAVAERGHFLHAPDTYMDKIACGPRAAGKIDLDFTPEENIKIVAMALNKSVENLTVSILDRPRHEELITRVRKMGARIRLIGDGDVSAGIAPCWEESGIDLLLGIGGAPEGVITAAALKCLGGDFQGRLKFRNEQEKSRAKQMGLKNPEQKLLRDDLAKGSVMFCATGVTDGPLLEGVRTLPGHRTQTHSIVMRSASGTVRRIEAEHNFVTKPDHLGTSVNTSRSTGGRV